MLQVSNSHIAMGPSIYDVNTEGEGGQAQVDGSSPMWTSTQKIKIRVNWRRPVFFMQRIWHPLLPEFRLWTE